MSDNDKLKEAAQLIADVCNGDGGLIKDEPYCWGLILAEVAVAVCSALKGSAAGEETYRVVRAGFASELWWTTPGR